MSVSNAGGRVALCVLLLLAGDRANADGRIEINEARVAEGGISAGDAPGYPATLSVSGSYILTSSLSTGRNTTGLEITADDVSVDLAGFAIQGGGSCNFTFPSGPLNCGPGAPTHTVGFGIVAMGAIRTAVRNGVVRGFAEDGLNLGAESQVTDVIADGNVGIGIRLGDTALVAGSTATSNFGGGILVGLGSVIDACVASQSGSDAIEAGTGSVAIDSVAAFNLGDGFSMAAGSVVHTSGANRNTLVGIDAGDGSLVSANSVRLNGSGIRTAQGAAVQRNDVRQNSVTGLNVGAQTAYTENRIVRTSGFTVIGSGISLFPNVCDGVATCP